MSAVTEGRAIVTWFLRAPAAGALRTASAAFHISTLSTDRSAALVAAAMAHPVGDLLSSGERIDGAVCVIWRNGEYGTPYLSDEAGRITAQCVNGAHPNHQHSTPAGFLSPQFG